MERLKIHHCLDWASGSASVSVRILSPSATYTGPSYASVFPLLSRVCFLCFVGLFCHTLSTFRSLYADHVPGWVYWEQQCLFGTNRWNEANWEHQRCPRTNHQTGSSLEKDSESSNQLGIRNWALQAWLFHLSSSVVLSWVNEVFSMCLPSPWKSELDYLTSWFSSHTNILFLKGKFH